MACSVLMTWRSSIPVQMTNTSRKVSGQRVAARFLGRYTLSGSTIWTLTVPSSLLSTTLLVLTCMRYPWIKKEDTHGYTRQSSLVARVGRVFGHLPGALPSPGGRGRLGALPDRVAHRIAQQELRHYGGGRPRDQ